MEWKRTVAKDLRSVENVNKHQNAKHETAVLAIIVPCSIRAFYVVGQIYIDWQDIISQVHLNLKPKRCKPPFGMAWILPLLAVNPFSMERVYIFQGTPRDGRSLEKNGIWKTLVQIRGSHFNVNDSRKASIWDSTLSRIWLKIAQSVATRQ